MNNKKVLTGLSLGLMGVATVSIVAEEAMQALEQSSEQETKVSKSDLRSRTLVRVGSSAKVNGSYHIDDSNVCHYSKLDIAIASACMQEGENVTKVQLVTDAEEQEDGVFAYPESADSGNSEGDTGTNEATTVETKGSILPSAILSGNEEKSDAKEVTLKDNVISEFEGNEGILSLNKSVKCQDLRVKFIINDNDTDAEYATLAELVPDFANITGYEVDSEAPNITFKEFNGETSNEGFITRNGNLSFDITDNVGVDATKIVAITDTQELTSVFKDGVLSINTNQLDDGEITLQLKVYDLSGNEATLEYPVKLLREAPPITGESHTKVEMVGGVSYIKSSLTVQLGGWDNLDIQSIDLLKGEDTVIQNITDGSFEISSTGEHRVKVTDVAGNVTIYRLEDLFSDLSSDIVVDGTVPEYTIKVNGEDVKDTWYTEATSIAISASDDNGIDDISAMVYYAEDEYEGAVTVANGAKEASLQIDLANDIPRSENGVYKIDVTITDMAGNADHSTIEVKADFDNPTIENAKLLGNYHIKDGKLFVSGEVSLTADTKDIGAGVDLVNIYKDEELVSTEFPVKIDTSGHYTFRVSDKSGRVSKEYSLGELLGIEETGVSDIVIDKDAPTITEVSGFTPDLVKGGNWFRNCPNIRVNVLDENLESVTATINGSEVDITANDAGIYVVDTSNVTGEAKLVITAKDKAENQNTLSFDYIVDQDAPSNITGTLNREYKHRFDKLYFNGTPTVSLFGDDLVGIESFKVNGEKLPEPVYTVESGEHLVEVTDFLGNTTGNLPLGGILGLESDIFIIDSEAPKIDCSRPSGDIDNWFNSDVRYLAQLSDNEGIFKATAKINGEEVDVFEATMANETNIMLEADTSKVNGGSGIYNVTIDVEDNAGNVTSWTDTIYIDKEAPIIDRFVFSGNGAFEGVEINGTDRYGFFFDGGATCDIYVSDGEVSSGIKEVVATLTPETGTSHQQRIPVTGGVAKVTIPEDYKGVIEAFAIDRVNNVGDSNRPDGVVTESSNAHLNAVDIDINLPTTGYTDMSGNSLYNQNVNLTATLGCKKSGLRHVEWGINGDTRGEIDVDSDGNASGNISALSSRGKNLILNMNSSMEVSDNENNLNVWVRLTDRAGHVSESSRIFSIDKDAPVINVTWDNTESDGFYNSTRTATVAIQERNFDPNQVTFSGVYGSLGTWVNDGGTWRNTITFSEDNKYQFGIACTDKAGNVGEAYSSETFTIDKTAPVLSVSWDNNSAVNGNYYKNSRTATVTVRDANFDESRVNFSGQGTLSSWSESNGVHTARLVYNQDGKYEFSISCTDKADNQSNTYTEPPFIIDQKEPDLKINGVQNGISYKKNFGFSVSISDTLIDKSKTEVTLVGRRNGEMEIDGVLNDTSGMFELNSFPEDAKYDDIYTLSAVVTDMAGNRKEESLVFSLNRYGSKYTFTDGSLLGNYINKPKRVEIIEENVDQLNMSKARVAVLRDGKELSIDDALIDVQEFDGEDGYDYTYTIEKEAFKKDGKYQVQIYSQAVEGTDYSNVSEEYEFVLDSKDPDIIISGIKSGGRYNEYQRKVSIDVRDTYGIKDIDVELNGKKVNLEKKDGIYSFDVKEDKRTQDIVVVAKDMAGNETKKSVDNFFISSNAFEFLINQLWFKVGIGAVIAFLGIIIGLIIKNIRDSKKKEASTLDEHEALYKATMGSTGLGSTISTEIPKDEAGNLDSGDVEYSTVTTSSDLEVNSDDTDATTTQV